MKNLKINLKILNRTDSVLVYGSTGAPHGIPLNDVIKVKDDRYKIFVPWGNTFIISQLFVQTAIMTQGYVA